MRKIKRLNQFKRDYKREISGRSREYIRKLDVELAEVLRMLAADLVLPLRFGDHSLSGDWKDHWDCHVRPDLVLIYRKPDQELLTLVRLGSHSELFGK
jgi:mRNA interferase YafQ